MAEEGSSSSFLYVPEELEEQILVWLPVKSILRFKSVCKRWHSLFHSKAFGEHYFGSLDIEAFIPTSEDLGLICPELRRRGRRSKRYKTSVIGPLSNGIYALSSFLLTPRDDQYNPHVLPHTLKIALFNPATRQVKFGAPFPDKYHNMLSGISSNNCSSSHECCSVYCGIDDAYRFVVLIKYEGARYEDCFLVFLYTWRTGVWKKLADYDLQLGTHLYNNMMACSQKLLNGCWHWMIEQLFKEEGETRFGVLSFDFERKSLEILCGPPCKPAYYADVFVLQDHLAAIVANDNDDYDEDFPRLEIWRKTKTMWTNIYSVTPAEFFMRSIVIVHSIDYYQVEEEIRIRRLILSNDFELHTFDNDEGHLVEGVDPSNPKMSLSVGGILKFTPTFEPLPL